MFNAKDLFSCPMARKLGTMLVLAQALLLPALSAQAAPDDSYIYAYIDDPYEHRAWRKFVNQGSWGQYRSARVSFTDHHDWQENFNLKFANSWLADTADSPDYVYVFDTDIRGGISVKSVQPGTTLEELSRSTIENFHNRVRSEGGRVLGVSSRPAMWGGMRARRIDQRFSYKDVPGVITCVTMVGLHKGREFKLEMAQFDRLYNSRDYRSLIESCIASLRTGF